MAILSAAATSSPYDVILAALNVAQTIALAYLAARSHVDRNGNGATKKSPRRRGRRVTNR